MSSVATISPMSKKKSTSTRKEADRHKEPKMTLRLPEPYRNLVREIADKEDRNFTKVIQRAIRLYAEANGFKDPTPPKQTEE